MHFVYTEIKEINDVVKKKLQNVHTQYRHVCKYRRVPTKLLTGNHFRMAGLRVERVKEASRFLFYMLQLCAHTNTCNGGQVLLWGKNCFLNPVSQHYGKITFSHMHTN